MLSAQPSCSVTRAPWQRANALEVAVARTLAQLAGRLRRVDLQLGAAAPEQLGDFGVAGPHRLEQGRVAPPVGGKWRGLT